jgi:hypothetical protein
MQSWSSPQCLSRTCASDAAAESCAAAALHAADWSHSRACQACQPLTHLQTTYVWPAGEDAGLRHVAARPAEQHCQLPGTPCQVRLHRPPAAPRRLQRLFRQRPSHHSRQQRSLLPAVERNAALAAAAARCAGEPRGAAPASVAAFARRALPTSTQAPQAILGGRRYQLVGVSAAGLGAADARRAIWRQVRCALAAACLQQATHPNLLPTRSCPCVPTSSMRKQVDALWQRSISFAAV